MPVSGSREELEALRMQTALACQAAAADLAKLQPLQALLTEIDLAMGRMAIDDFAAMARALDVFRARLDALTRVVLAWPFGKTDAPKDHERPVRIVLPDTDFQDEGPTAPPPPPPTPEKPVPPAAVPAVTPGWAENYSSLWNTMEILPQWQKTAVAIAEKIVASQGRYANAVNGTSVPWWFVAVVHSMECSLRFDEHLHNGDPLTGRTVRVPPGRPPAGGPSFTWEESARDALFHQRLDKITDWSLANAMFNWHRYNGINNEYKRRGIPTPYLWSGSQHYRKGKYVADGVFDPEAVSRQVGAAVLLRALVDLGAVNIEGGRKKQVTGNPAAAGGDVTTLDIDTTGFAHAKAELAYPGLLKKGVSGKKAGIQRVQEWLRIHELRTPLDSDFGDSTEEQLKAFQAKAGRAATGELDPETWALLTAPMRKALAKIDKAETMALEDLVVAIATQHIAQKPIEVGGNNLGPWTRLYMEGRDGPEQLWCAGFVCFIVAQAMRDLGRDKLPFRRQVGVPAMAADAKASGRLIAEAEVATALERRSKIRPGHVFLVRNGSGNYTHTGIVLRLKETTFDTLEGNRGAEGGNDGPNASEGNVSFSGKDFMRLL
jgi:lysozyme family protein